MDRRGPEAEPQFSQPIRQITTMLIVLGLTGAGAYLAFPSVASVFLANPWLNGFIVFVFGIGVVACFWQVFTLISSVGWIEGFARNRTGHEVTRPPRLLTPLATLLRSRGARLQLSSSSTQSILDSVATRIDEAREITRYIVNLLVFLGLLGTFYGLAITVPALVETIRSLAPEDGEGGVEVFNRLMAGLEDQLGGMGVAFASSLLGLAGSLVVGLLELFAGHGQNRFYRELEEWLSTITRVGIGSTDGEGGDAGLMASVIDGLAEQMESLQLLFTQSDIARSAVDEKLGTLADAVDRMVTRMVERDADDAPLRLIAQGNEAVSEGQERIITGQNRLAEGQNEVARLLKGIGESLKSPERPATGEEPDAETRMRLRSMDTQMLRILEELSAGREETVADLRGEIANVAAAIRTATGQPQEIE